MARNSLGQRSTSQRDAIAGVIREAEGPLTINEIHERAGRQVPRLGVATVYRTVKLMLESHEVHAVMLPDGQQRFESADLGHHDHFRCRECNHVFDLPVCPLSLPKGTIFPGGFRVEDHELTIYGLCPKCAKMPAAVKKADTQPHHHHHH